MMGDDENIRYFLERANECELLAGIALNAATAENYAEERDRWRRLAADYYRMKSAYAVLAMRAGRRRELADFAGPAVAASVARGAIT